MRTRILLLAAVMFLGTTQLNFGRDAKTDKDKLQGTWEIVDFVRDGKKVERKIGAPVFFTGDKMSEGKEDPGLTSLYQLDEKAQPKALEFLSPADARPEAQLKNLGIYRFVEDKLQICIALPKAARPTEFAAGKGQMLITLKRIKK